MNTDYSLNKDSLTDPDYKDTFVGCCSKMMCWGWQKSWQKSL